MWASGRGWGSGLDRAAEPVPVLARWSLSRPPGPARRLSCWTPGGPGRGVALRSPAPEGGRCGQVAVGLLPPCAPCRGHPAVGRDNPCLARLRAACQASPAVSGVVRSLLPPPPRGSRGLPVRRKQVPPVAVLAGLLLLGKPPRGRSLLPIDRCGDLVLSWAGPKPRQTRDGRPRRMRPLFSFCPRAPPSPAPPRPAVVAGARGARAGVGGGADSGPTPASRLLASRRWRDRGPRTRRTLSPAFPEGPGSVASGPPLLRGGGPARRRAAHRPAWARLSALRPALRGAPVALQVASGA